MTWKGSWFSCLDSTGSQISPPLQGGSLQRAPVANLLIRKPPHSIGSWTIHRPDAQTIPDLLNLGSWKASDYPNLDCKDLFILIQKDLFYSFLFFFSLLLIFFLISYFRSFTSFCRFFRFFLHLFWSLREFPLLMIYLFLLDHHDLEGELNLFPEVSR